MSVSIVKKFSLKSRPIGPISASFGRGPNPHNFPCKSNCDTEISAVENPITWNFLRFSFFVRKSLAIFCAQYTLPS